jgi:hypothetical protein
MLLTANLRAFAGYMLVQIDSWMNGTGRRGADEFPDKPLKFPVLS